MNASPLLRELSSMAIEALHLTTDAFAIAGLLPREAARAVDREVGSAPMSMHDLVHFPEHQKA